MHHSVGCEAESLENGRVSTQKALHAIRRLSTYRYLYSLVPSQCIIALFRDVAWTIRRQGLGLFWTRLDSTHLSLIVQTTLKRIPEVVVTIQITSELVCLSSWLADMSIL